MTKYLPQSGGTIALDLGLQVENQWNFTCKVAIDETTTTLEGATLVSDIISFEPETHLLFKLISLSLRRPPEMWV